jgi:hypothetical protein
VQLGRRRSRPRLAVEANATTKRDRGAGYRHRSRRSKHSSYPCTARYIYNQQLPAVSTLRAAGLFCLPSEPIETRSNQCSLERCGQPTDVLLCEYKRWSDLNGVAARSGSTDQYPVVPHRVRDRACAGRLVEFDPDEQAESADVSDRGVTDGSDARAK